MSTPADRIVELHRSLTGAGIDHAFGGALALAWCTGRARGTLDIDMNVFLPVDRVDELVRALPEAMFVSDDEHLTLQRDGQCRLWYGSLPVDVFLSTTPFHGWANGRVRHEQFNGESIPFLSCSDLAIFKAFFDRPKDWEDLEEMLLVGTLDLAAVAKTLFEFLPSDDPRLEKLRQLNR